MTYYCFQNDDDFYCDDDDDGYDDDDTYIPGLLQLSIHCTIQLEQQRNEITRN